MLVPLHSKPAPQPIEPIPSDSAVGMGSMLVDTVNIVFKASRVRLPNIPPLRMSGPPPP